MTIERHRSNHRMCHVIARGPTLFLAGQVARTPTATIAGRTSRYDSQRNDSRRSPDKE